MMEISSALDQITHTIQVLQQIQRLLTISATLSDVVDLLAYIEAEYGAEIRIEDIIQHLEGQHLALQLDRRRATRRVSQKRLEIVA